jgi:hypothetical protein
MNVYRALSGGSNEMEGGEEKERILRGEDGRGIGTITEEMNLFTVHCVHV